MLGRLEMDAESCIKAYTNLMEDIFAKRTKPIDWKLNVKGQFSEKALEMAIKSLIPPNEDPEEALLNDSRSDKRPCRVYVLYCCEVQSSHADLIQLRVYNQEE